MSQVNNNQADNKIAAKNLVTINKSDIPSGGMKSYKQDDDSIILITRDEDEFFAFDGKCPHVGADLGDGMRCGNRVVCPWHHGSFDSRDGTLLEPVAMRGLTQYELTDEGDSLTVNTSAKIDKRVENDKLTDTHTIIVGGGGAGFMTANQLRHTGYGGKITLISKDDKAPYNRPLLSKAFLAGKMEEKYLMLGGSEWASKNNIELRLNQTVSEVLPNERTIVMKDESGNSEQQTADFLVVATGAEPKIPPFEGADLDGVYTLRSMDDAKDIKAASDNKHVVIVGTGFIGMEAASALTEAGKAASVTVIGRSRRVMSNIVSETVSNALIKLHEEKGVKFVFGAGVDEINGEGSKVSGVKLSDGSTIAADVVILGTGVAPRTEMLNEVNAPDGVQVDEHLQLRDGVYALGDIAKATNQMGRMRIEHWRVALQHGIVTAAAILNQDNVNTLEERIPFFWTAQYGKSLRYSGYAASPDNNILFGSPDTLDYIEYYFDDDGEDTRASAASTLGRDKELVAFSELLRRGHGPTRAQINVGFNLIDQAQALSR
ncbi:FAD-dependent oxidoreductase [Psychrobacter sp. P2G3]|uniref:FAD-dependent oxidoreductase n=1 Tax=Psychrobacter sp. P2G3 TaxID=1699622 RepID=UPI00078BB251|nr:FAD-dependent oxidoreductase [Psychrobacter sp. P2G3]AMN50307.1 pyridine nucleotide-disulfide oxidoreductase [Psychrobacter sp. P2G3]